VNKKLEKHRDEEADYFWWDGRNEIAIRDRMSFKKGHDSSTEFHAPGIKALKKLVAEDWHYTEKFRSGKSIGFDSKTVREIQEVARQALIDMGYIDEPGEARNDRRESE